MIAHSLQCGCCSLDAKASQIECGPYSQLSEGASHVCTALEQTTVIIPTASIPTKSMHRYCGRLSRSLFSSLVSLNFNSSIISRDRTSFSHRFTYLFCANWVGSFHSSALLFWYSTYSANQAEPIIKSQTFDCRQPVSNAYELVWFICSISILMGDNFLL